MKKKTPQRPKHIPQRTCVGCRETLSKRQLTRVVRTASGIKIDPTGKLDGRGAYVHDQRECWARALKGTLAGALRAEISAEDRALLEEFMNSLPQQAETKETQ